MLCVGSKKRQYFGFLVYTGLVSACRHFGSRLLFVFVLAGTCVFSFTKSQMKKFVVLGLTMGATSERLDLAGKDSGNGLFAFKDATEEEARKTTGRELRRLMMEETDPARLDLSMDPTKQPTEQSTNQPIVFWICLAALAALAIVVVILMVAWFWLLWMPLSPRRRQYQEQEERLSQELEENEF